MLALGKSALVLVVVAVLQLELFSDLRILGVMPELLLGLAITTGWQGGSDRGAIFGFCAGLLYDLYLPTPFALSAITYAFVGYGVGVAAEMLAQDGHRLIRSVVAMSAVATGLVLFVTIGELLDQPNLYNDGFTKIVVVATLYTGLLLPALHRATDWSLSSTDGATYTRDVGLVK